MVTLSLTDTQQIGLFLTLLDANAKSKPFDFRTFDDRKDRSRRDLCGNLSGTFDDKKGELRSRNAEGAGVFVVVNEGGHTSAEITRVRAVFADTDGAPLEPIVEALTPHCVIATSPGKFHVYWLVDNDFPLDRFTPIQKAIARKFGTDGKVCDLSRVMRLPGFAHQKSDPFMVKFHVAKNADQPRYSVDQIIEGLGLHVFFDRSAPPREADAAGLPFSCPLSSASHSLREVEEMLRFIEPWDRAVWMSVLFALADEFGEVGYELALRWSRGDLLSTPQMLGAKP
jgi:hypothetical protein